MSTRHLDTLFKPGSVAVVGASERWDSIGGALLKNILAARFNGRVAVVNRKKYPSVHGVPCYPSVRSLPWAPDLGILCTPPKTIPKLVKQLNLKGCRVAVVIMGGMADQAQHSLFAELKILADGLLGRRIHKDVTLTELALEATDIDGIRMLGPNTLGAIVPGRNLNASYAHLAVQSGRIALVAESAVFALGLIDWAVGKGIGFSHIVSLGDDVDIGAADILEYMAEEERSRIVLMQIDTVRSGHSLMSGLRTAARKKMVVVLKTRLQSSISDSSITVDADRVFSKAMQRAGALRVGTSDEMYAALDILTRVRSVAGGRLAIISNGLGSGVLASDAVIRNSGELAKLSESTWARLAPSMPPFWRPSNPVNMNVIALPDSYEVAISALSADPGVDAVLVLHTPTLSAPAEATAHSVVKAAKKAAVALIAGFIGEATARDARRILDENGIPAFDTPEQAVAAWMYLVAYQRGQMALRQTPVEDRGEETVDPAVAWGVVDEARRSEQAFLHPAKICELLREYGLPYADCRFAADEGEAVAIARTFGFPLAVRVLYRAALQPYVDPGLPDGVRVDLDSEEQLREAMRSLREQFGRSGVGQAPVGYEIQRMRRGLQSLKINLGFFRDADFGPVLAFGSGANPADIRKDRHYELMPLNGNLAADLVSRSAIGYRIEALGRDVGADLRSLSTLLLRLSRLCIDLPILSALEIQPLVLNREGFEAQGVKGALGEAMSPAIAAYPRNLERRVTLKGVTGRVVVRPIRGEDEPAYLAFLRGLSTTTRRLRFFGTKADFTHLELARLTQIDYQREMAFIAIGNLGGVRRTLGDVRAWFDPDNIRTEFAVVVGDEVAGLGLGKLLLNRMIEYGREKGTLEIVGTVLADNQPMLGLVKRLGFSRTKVPGEDTFWVALSLNEPGYNWQRERLRTGTASGATKSRKKKPPRA